MTDKLKPRLYQTECFNKYKDDDVIINLPTGSGKTLIACLAINHELEVQKTKKVIVICPTVMVVLQQKKVFQKECGDNKVSIKVMELYGDKVQTETSQKKKYDNDLNDTIWETHKPEFDQSSVIVSTPELIRQMLNKQYLKVSDCSLFVFDECHNAKGKSAMAEVCRFLSENKVSSGYKPRILGLTASFENSRITGDSKLNNAKRKLEDLTNCELFAPNSKEIDETFSDKAKSIEYEAADEALKVETISYKKLDESDQIEEVLQEIDLKFLVNFLIYFKKKDAIGSKILDEIKYIFIDLGFFGVLIYLRDILYPEFLQGLVDGDGGSGGGRGAAESYRFPYEKLYLEWKSDRTHVDVYDSGNTHSVGNNTHIDIRSNKYLSLLKLLKNPEKGCKDKKGIIFCERKILSNVLRGLLQIDLSKKTRVQPIIELAIGGSGMSATDCQGNIQRFRDNDVAILVSTAVAQEGIDVSNCSFTITYNFLPNTKAFIQSKGRARQKNSRNYLFENDAKQELEKEASMNRAARDTTSSLSSQDKVQNDKFVRDRLAKYKHLHPYYPPPDASGGGGGGGRERTPIKLQDSIPLVHQFCTHIFSKMESDKLLVYQKLNESKKICSIRLPTKLGWKYIEAQEVNDYFTDKETKEIIPLENILGFPPKDAKDEEKMKFFYLAAIELSKLGYLNKLNECCVAKDDFLNNCEIDSIDDCDKLKSKRKIVNYSNTVIDGPIAFHHLWTCPLLDNDGGETCEPLTDIDLKTEKKLIPEILKKSGKQVSLRSAVATRKELIEEAKDCQILHFSGHGFKAQGTAEGDDYLAFEYRYEVDTENLGKMDKFKDGDIEKELPESFAPVLVFLSACHSQRSGEALINMGIQHVIAIDREHEIDNDAARIFATYFYDCLLVKGFNLQKSFNHAKQDCQRHYPSESEKFLLLPKNDIRHTEKVFQVPQRSGQFINQSPKTPMGNLARFIPDLVERYELVQELYSAFHFEKNKLFFVTGESGIGTTQVALHMLNYSSDRSELDAYFMLKGGDYRLNSTENNNIQLNVARKLCKLVLMKTELPSPDIDEFLNTYSSYEDLLRDVFFKRCPQRVVVLFDGFDGFSVDGIGSQLPFGILECLHHSTTSCNKTDIRIVITAKTLPPNTVFSSEVIDEHPVLHLEKTKAEELYLNRREAKQYVKPTTSQLKKIMRSLKGNPRAIIEAAEIELLD